MNSRLSSSKSLQISRILNLDFDEAHAILLFGPRKSGKTTLIKQRFPNAKVFDLLLSEVRIPFTLNPSLLKQYVLENPDQIFVIDEIQKVPALLDEVHWLLENTSAKFILCGSSARKLKRGASNLLGGRAYRYDLFPLVYKEAPNFDLIKAINHGLLPQHYLSLNTNKLLRSYVDQYLQEEIIEESNIRKLPSFYRFLEVAALMNGELLNYANVGSDCGVSGKTVREYYQILEDTFLGFTLNPWTKIKKRNLIETAKFYLSDTGVLRTLKGVGHLLPKTSEFGNAFETLLINEIRAYLHYKSSNLKISFWRTTSNFEVDLILGPMKYALEFKSTDQLRSNDFRGLKALMEEHSPEKKIIVCCEKNARKLKNGVHIMPYEYFLNSLWNDKLF